jgi:hypothetical protein
MNRKTQRNVSFAIGAESLHQAVLYVWAFAFLILLALPNMVRAQVGAADVLGIVTDPSGAVVVNATVTVKNLGTSAIRTVNTDERGGYTFTLLPNGSYTLQVEAPGFKIFAVPQFSLSTGERARFDAQLQTGAVSEKVVVTGEAAVLQTDTSTVGNTVAEKTVQDLPLNGRNFVNAIQIEPGITAGYSGIVGSLRQGELDSSGNTADDRRPQSTVVANGQSPALNNNVIDGFDNNERSMGVIAVRPSLDGIEEMKVDTNSYRAEYGRTPGAVINIVTKSGTNNFHGSAYEYFQNDIFDVRDWFTHLTPEYRLNEFGGSAGGPIIRDKTFFFADVEDDRIIQGIPFLSTVPTNYERENPGDLSDAGGPNLIAMGVPLSKIGLAIFNLYPYPNLPGTVSNYSSTPNKTQFGATVDGRVDHRFSPNDLFFARYAYNPVNTVFPESFPRDPATGIYPGGKTVDYPGPSTTTAQNLQLDYVHIFNPRLLLDLKAAYTRVNIHSESLNYGTGAADKLGIPNVNIPGVPGTNGMPGLPIFSWDALGDCHGLPIFNTNNAFQYSASLSYTRGLHNLKFGGALIRRQLNTFQNYNGTGAFVFIGAPPYFDDRANLLTGSPGVELRQNQLDTPGFRTWEPGFYAQDDWRVRPRLTVNLGLRYDVLTPFSEAHGQYANFNLNSLSSGVGAQNFIMGTQSSTIGVDTDFKDVSPRIGFAYSITPKTVLRGGFAMSFFPPDVGASIFVDAQAPSSLMQNYNPPYSFNYTIVAPGSLSLSSGFVVPEKVDLSTYARDPNVTSVSEKASNLRPSYAEQMNLFLQREFGANTVTVGYVGVLGRGLLRTVNADLPDPPGPGNPTPQFIYQQQLPYVSVISYSYNGSSSNYNAMQLIFTRRFTSGLSIDGNYTWGHGLSNNLYNTITSNPSVDYGNTFFDIRQRVAANGSYEIPIAKNATGVKAIALKGWQANSVFYWQTGIPFTVDSQALAPNGLSYINQPGVSVERPDLIGKAVLSHPTRTSSGTIQYINPDAFTPPVQGTVGTERVNQLIGPRDRRDDLSLMKTFDVKENLKLQFRAECFNISNTPNFGNADDTVSTWITGTSGTLVPASAGQGDPFGQISSLAGNEVPRQFQFALKLLY